MNTAFYFGLVNLTPKSMLQYTKYKTMFHMKYRWRWRIIMNTS